MHVVVMGCGRAGSRLAQYLDDQNNSVAVIDKDPASFHLLGPDFKGKTIVGVGFDSNTLLEAEINEADAFIAVGSGDNSNIVSSKVAKDVFHVPTVIARIYDPRRAEIYRRLGIPTIAPVTWGVNKIINMLSLEMTGARDALGSGGVELLELDIHIPPKLVGKKVSECEIPGEISVTSIERQGEKFIPVADTVFEEGDLAHVFVPAASMSKLRKKFFIS